MTCCRARQETKYVGKIDASLNGSSNELVNFSRLATTSGSRSSSWCSVSNFCATNRAYCDSSKSACWNPIANVLTGLELARAISATMVEESVPPLNIAPSGTSEIKRMRVASASRASISSRHSSSLIGLCVPYSGRSQYLRTRTSPLWNSSKCPGGSL